MSYKVKIVADTVSPFVKTARITSFEIYAPRILLAEINTHRILAKSAQSSRAVPVEKRIDNVIEDPFIPEFGRNNKGMQSEGPLEEAVRLAVDKIWVDQIAATIIAARAMKDKEAHKQWVNRMLEPYAHFYGVITGTEWENFWNLRTSAAAQPEFQTLAKMMRAEYDRSTPSKSRLHFPYFDDGIQQYDLDVVWKVSAARCARVSYKNHDGTDFDINKDLSLCNDLIEQGHLSPFDHPAYADTLSLDYTDKQYYYTNPLNHRQFWGWIPHRVDIERAKGWTLRRDSYAPIPVEDIDD